MKALTGTIILALAMSLGLSACGRKNPPKPPMGYQPPADQSSQDPEIGNRPIDQPTEKDHP